MYSLNCPKRDKTWWISLLQSISIRNMHLCCGSAHCWRGYLGVICIYLNAFLHLAMDVTPACEHCRTSIWNVLWRNPISGFNGSSEAAHPGSHEIYALVKLVYSINFPIFNYWHYCSACYCFFARNVFNQFGVDRRWAPLRWLQISWWDLHRRT